MRLVSVEGEYQITAALDDDGPDDGRMLCLSLSPQTVVSLARDAIDLVLSREIADR